MAHRRPAGGASSPSSSVTDNENAIRLLESLQNDFKCLSMETKKKYPQIKEVSTSVFCYHFYLSSTGETPVVRSLLNVQRAAFLYIPSCLFNSVDYIRYIYNMFTGVRRGHCQVAELCGSCC